MRVEIRADPEQAGACAAGIIAAELRAAIAARGKATLALSGGSTPRSMLQHLVREELPWSSVHVLQVDERVVTADDAQRNLGQLLTAFAGRAEPRPQIHAMPVELTDTAAAVRAYAQTLRTVASVPPVIDVVHLGLGEDGHTASLVAGDEALRSDADVVMAGPYRGTRRMTLTLGALNRARRRVWLVTGSEKRRVLAALLSGAPTLVAGKIQPEGSIVVTDRSAAGDRE